MQLGTFSRIAHYGMIGIVLLTGATVAHAAVSHFEIPAPAQNVPSVDSFMTTGADMAGMSVTAFFSAGAPETVPWVAGVGAAGSATGTNWTMATSGDTFSSPWTLLYTGGSGLLTGFRIDGFAAGQGNIGVMFDRTFNAVFGTPNSALGRDLELVNAVPFDVFVTYEGTVGVAGNAAVGDEFRWLNARFVNFGGVADEFTTVPPPVAGLNGDNLRELIFRQDTNNPIVPEPAAAVLLLVGGATIWLLRRRAAAKKR
jgi:hypothetical protein